MISSPHQPKVLSKLTINRSQNPPLQPDGTEPWATKNCHVRVAGAKAVGQMAFSW
jgi:hypothetical protein